MRLQFIELSHVELAAFNFGMVVFSHDAWVERRELPTRRLRTRRAT